jgi:hypothetical protein
MKAWRFIMITSKLSVLAQSTKAIMRRGHLALVGGLTLVTIMVAGTQANARPVEFCFTGGAWSRGFHAGWHHYWGGPSIGFYYAPEPAYIVSGYAAPSYYSGPDFWYSNPSFGLSLNFGGGGYYRGGYYPDRGVRYPVGGFHEGGFYEGGARYPGGGFHEDHARYPGGGFHEDHARYPGGGFHEGGFRNFGGGFHEDHVRYSGGDRGHGESYGRGSFRGERER